MSCVFSKKNVPVQKLAGHRASAVLDNSSQNESLQRKVDMANNAAQRAEAPRPNNTGMPDNLKSGIESLSGFSMDDVRVHYNSSKPATVQALAYTQGTDIHVAPGQEKHLPHEAWHVAQQMAGRVSPTTNINGMPVNDNAALEHEADVMGEKAVTQRMENVGNGNRKATCKNNQVSQMLRVINAYEFFDNVKWNSLTPEEKSDYRLDATQNLREKYIQKAKLLIEQIKNEKDIQKKLAIRRKLKQYAPNSFMEMDFNKIEKEVEQRINVQTFSLTNGLFLGENENLAIVAHGSKTSFADFDPKTLADKVWNLLPENYSGEIYLAGCQTGKQYNNEKNEQTSYIQEFYKELLNRDAIGPKKNIMPSIKGDRNYSSIEKNHVYVEGWDGPDKKAQYYFFDLKKNRYDYFGGTYNVRSYYGKLGKLHIDQKGNVIDSRASKLPDEKWLSESVLGIIQFYHTNVDKKTLCDYLNVDEVTITPILLKLETDGKIKRFGTTFSLSPPPLPPRNSVTLKP